MDSLTTFVRAETLAFLGALASVAAFQALTGKIGLRGLVFEKGSAGRQSRGLSAARVQHLAVTVLAVIAYLTLAGDPQGGLPRLSAGLPLVVGAGSTRRCCGRPHDR